jgi:O-antigen chain-terminating methyltransferase
VAEDDFYATLTDRYRGSSEMIKSRLEGTYLPYIEPLARLYSGDVAIDLGCGRGEWLELLAAQGLAPLGVDLDEPMLAACRGRGLSVEKRDALEVLQARADQSAVAVSGFHIVEHMPFEVLRKLVREALRVLKPGGLLIFETPNPENILVSTSRFYLDPTHQRPIPPALLALVAEHAGFARVKLLRLYESPEILSKPELSLLDVLDGASPDYAIVAQKRGSDEQMATMDHAFEMESGLTLEAVTMRYHGLADLRLARTETRLAQAESAFAQAELAFAQAEARLAQAESRLGQAESRIDQAERRALQAEQELQAVYESHSWRFTRPLRRLSAWINRKPGNGRE